jgi:hypothetical protein
MNHSVVDLMMSLSPARHTGSITPLSKVALSEPGNIQMAVLGTWPHGLVISHYFEGPWDLLAHNQLLGKPQKQCGLTHVLPSKPGTLTSEQAQHQGHQTCVLVTLVHPAPTAPQLLTLYVPQGCRLHPRLHQAVAAGAELCGFVQLQPNSKQQNKKWWAHQGR